ncbi:MAG: response regulator [Verrucomicrobiae bacterium]|nr:response regulator [Verrucomicrobiae bacterium]
MKILLVDDQVTIRTFLREAILSLGHEVAGEASDGLEALSLYEAVKPDLVLMDIDIPIMNGFDIIDLSRRVDPNARIVVITGTGRGAEEAHNAGAISLLRKPFSAEDLEKIVGRIDAAMREDPKVRPKRLTEILNKPTPRGQGSIPE